jgi:drug/metabolite transporter (DMT)-like permease
MLESTAMNPKILLLMLGVFACSTAALMIRASDMHPILLAAYRLILAGLVLLPVYFRDARRHRASYGWRDLRAAIIPGILLGAHFISWISAVHMTTVANATLLVNLVPIAMPFLLLLMMGERLNLTELIGTVLALAGLYLLVAEDFNLDRSHFLGDMLCLVSMLLLSLYLVYGRRNGAMASIWLYVVPLYIFGGIFCLLTALFFVNPIQAYSARDIVVVAGLVLVPTVIGHSILNHCMKALRGQLVSIVNLTQFIYAGIMAFIFFGEIPRVSFYIASSLLLTGAVIAIRGLPPARNPTPRP